MTTHQKDRKKLSKHLLEMKFMKLSKERVEQEENDEETRNMFYGHIPDQLKPTSMYIVQPSWVICEGLKCGRRSFRGMNPIIERLMESESEDKIHVKREIKEEDVDITAEEMVKFREEESTLVETVARKFQSRNDHPPIKKRKFLKPQDD